MPELTHVFVYGTLMRAERLHHYLATQAFIGDAILPDAELLLPYAQGPFPALRPCAGSRVRGEVYAVDAETLATLDSIEGAGWSDGMYRRELARVVLPDETTMQVYVYTWNRSTLGMAVIGESWRAYQEGR